MHFDCATKLLLLTDLRDLRVLRVESSPVLIARFQFSHLLASQNVSIHLVVLNYNGRTLLADCLPSVVAAAARSSRPCRVSVIDNDSTDDSCAWLQANWPEVTVHRCTNRGLISYNDVLAKLDEPVVVLLNNDIRLADDAIDPLVAPLFDTSPQREPVWMTAPRAWLFDGVTYEGFRTGVSWHWGLLSATARFEQAERIQDVSGETALAGAALAVDRRKFLDLGGFDPLYLPGRIEDVDLAYRAFQSGYVARYVPDSHAWHQGEATFASELGSARSYRLALRNTLLFQLKHLRHPVHVVRLLLGISLRIVADVIRAPAQTSDRRFAFTRALFDALPRIVAALRSPYRGQNTNARELEFFARYCVPQLTASALGIDPTEDESRRWLRHPISRWYLPPIVEPIVRFLTPSAVRPQHLTALGLLCAMIAAVGMIATQSVAWWSLGLVWFAWLCDRTDGPLARRQLTATARGARFDAATDEIVDLGLHGAIAAVAAAQTHTILPWLALVAFIASKGLFAHLTTDHSRLPTPDCRLPTPHSPLLRTLYNLPGNTDVRLHVLLAAMVTGWLTTELLAVAGYYTLRWVVVLAKSLLRASPLTAKGAVS